MTLSEAKSLLDANYIFYSELHFCSTAEFRLHISPFANLVNAKACPVIALTISSNNRNKNIELQFIDEKGDGDYSFVDLYFGQYCYELCNCQEELLQQSIIDEINSIISNDVIVIVANNLTRKKWFSDQIFDKKETDGFGLPGLEKAIRRIKKKKGLAAKLFGLRMQYEIYDWNTYQCIVK